MNNKTRTTIHSEIARLNTLKEGRARQSDKPPRQTSHPWYRDIGIIVVTVLGTLTIMEAFETVKELAARTTELEQENARLAQIVNRPGIDLYAPLGDLDQVSPQYRPASKRWDGYREVIQPNSQGI